MLDTVFNEHKAKLDKLQLVALAGLMFLGAAFVYSATTAGDSDSSAALINQLWFRQIAYYVMGIGVAVVLCFVDYHTMARWSVVIYWAAILMLVLVLIPKIGTVRFGARRWFDFGVFLFQPSEFAKLAFIMAMANFLSRPADELKQPAIFWKAIGMTVLPAGLILKEPDLGSALLLFPVGLAMMFISGIRARYLAWLVGGVGIVGSLFIVDILFAPPGWQIKLEDYQRERLLVYFDADFAPPNATPQQRADAEQRKFQKSYQVQQALISVGSGGLWGAGWHQGKQTALKFMPAGAAHNDFIFSVIAEEEGFVGSLIVLTLYSVVLFSGIRIAGQARDRLGKLMAVGVVTLLFSQVFINIGMHIKLVPVTGIPLPLLSYGGSSVIGSLIAMGILQNVYYYRKGY